jgi:hypothetical protein
LRPKSLSYCAAVGHTSIASTSSSSRNLEVCNEAGLQRTNQKV